MIAQCSPARDGTESRSARVKRELLAETNGLYTTSELSYFSPLNSLRKARSHSKNLSSKKLSSKEFVIQSEAKDPCFGSVIQSEAKDPCFGFVIQSEAKDLCTPLQRH